MSEKNAQQPKKNEDREITKEEVFRLLYATPAIFLAMLVATWEALQHDFALALNDGILTAYMCELLFHEKMNDVAMPLAGAGIFLVRDLIVRFSEAPKGIDLNLLAAALCFLEAARTAYATHDKDKK